ncbi:membrane protein insertase, YidC/Oxa1 family, C-terminal domain-containing protein [Ruminococcaceae bacterium YRB3002]|nr:membrane protein insertase, YidC/Oxa1 family, C-terminal domain-containing protein [Ruminococcaceae bacterium YRB3002]
MGTILYTILIKPLELIFELIFSVSNDIVPNPAVNIVILSLAVNLLVLPLYQRADSIQMETRNRENELRPVIDHIKKCFKGDEKVLMLQTYYKINNYSPLSSLKSMLSLLLQIPFFIAAYSFLSKLPLLNGQSMGPVADLAKPDVLITIGGISINLLPVLMTVINIISSEIYTKGQLFKDKIVLYLTAALFLVLLYDSPSGLVFYWTLNNVFALVKNLFNKMKDPALAVGIACLAAGIGIAVFTAVRCGSLSGDQIIILITVSIILAVPFLLHIVHDKLAPKITLISERFGENENIIFWLSAVYMTVLTGVVIPSNIVVSCTEDFLQTLNAANPAHYVYYALMMASGLFIVWIGVYYLLGNRMMRTVYSYAGLIVCIDATLNYMCFGIDSNGMLFSDLRFVVWLRPDAVLNILTAVSLLVIAAIVILLSKYIRKFFWVILLAGIISLSAIGVTNISKINDDYREYVMLMSKGDKPEITLSRNSKNVVVIMLDRAIGGLVPYIFNEKPELKDSFDGFTYFPNTISHGIYTNFGSPALYGGYEYITEAMNERDDISLKDKHNEALLLMPLLFRDAGYEVATIDPPYADYRYVSDLSIFDGYDHIHAYRMNGLYNEYADDSFSQSKMQLERNFFLHSIFKISLSAYKGIIYDNGKYNSLNLERAVQTGKYTFPQIMDSMSVGSGVDSTFMDAYTALMAIPSCTHITDDSSNNLIMLNNKVPHAFIVLQEPGYTVEENVDNTDYDTNNTQRFVNGGRKIEVNNYYQMGLYHTNMVAYLGLSEWFDMLQREGVWDNTRIIIVADHGYSGGHFSELLLPYNDFDAEFANPVLMVKDFDSHGFKTSDEFMTNADVPAIAVEGIISDPVNPFTGNPVNNDAKTAGPQKILESYNFFINHNNGNRYEPGNWYSVHDNIFDKNNWEYMGEY